MTAHSWPRSPRCRRPRPHRRCPRRPGRGRNGQITTRWNARCEFTVFRRRKKQRKNLAAGPAAPITSKGLHRGAEGRHSYPSDRQAVHRPDPADCEVVHRFFKSESRGDGGRDFRHAGGVRGAGRGSPGAARGASVPAGGVQRAPAPRKRRPEKAAGGAGTAAVLQNGESGPAGHQPTAAAAGKGAIWVPVKTAGGMGCERASPGHGTQGRPGGRRRGCCALRQRHVDDAAPDFRFAAAATPPRAVGSGKRPKLRSLPAKFRVQRAAVGDRSHGSTFQHGACPAAEHDKSENASGDGLGGTENNQLVMPGQRRNTTQIDGAHFVQHQHSGFFPLGDAQGPIEPDLRASRHSVPTLLASAAGAGSFGVSAAPKQPSLPALDALPSFSLSSGQPLDSISDVSYGWEDDEVRCRICHTANNGTSMLQCDCIGLDVGKPPDSWVCSSCAGG
ncbi:MAG: hypothetical protein BJ554DRAFT_7374 [Olpidium bornovanus]|uniref:PHD-type domain-containing protein n=1 Tax=Olpidium bornovanus TaxID=278681 RepID=A0A8H8DJH2_9FUNG|nr:MAG: hypothetical protein BJ554DRAFT_7374 [Olpidium bornovanus]